MKATNQKGTIPKMAKVIEIQVCGGRITTGLLDMCSAYIQNVEEGTDSPKLHFTIMMDDNTVRHITFRQEDESIVGYGNFEGLPSFLDYTKAIQKKLAANQNRTTPGK